MERLEIDLPQDMASFVEEAAGGKLASERAGDYVRLLIADQMEKRARLIDELEKGLKSGVSALTFDQIIDRARERARSRAV